MKIVRATLDMAGDIGYVHAASWRAAYRGIVPDAVLEGITPENRAERFRKTLPQSPDEFYIAYLDDKAIGMMVIGKSRDEDADETVGEISALYLLPDYWRKGCGRRMMNYAIERLKALSFRSITLWVLEENERARAFYQGFGYAFDGTKKPITIGKPLIQVRYAYTIKL